MKKSTIRKCLVLTICISLGLLTLACIPAYASPPKKQIVLKISSFLPLAHATSRALSDFAKEIELKSQERIKCELYWSGALGKNKQHYDMAVTGVADITIFVTAYAPGRFPLISVATLPLAFVSSPQGTEITQKFYKEYLFKNGEFNDVKLLSLLFSPPYPLGTTKKAIRTVKDFKGVKVRTPGAGVTDVLKALGSIPVTLAPGEDYTALERGIVDGVVNSYSTMDSYKLYELIGHVTEAGLGGIIVCYQMNKKSYERLPADLKSVIDKAGEKLGMNGANHFFKIDSKVREQFKVRGIEIITFSDKEMKQMREKVIPLYDKWAKDKEDRGLPGREVLKEFLGRL